MQIRLMLSAIALVALSIFANAHAADDRVKIGVLTDMNGPYAAITGKGSVAAAELAIEHFGGKALGKSVELVVADHMQKPDVGASIARKWYDNEGVDAGLKGQLRTGGNRPIFIGRGAGQDDIRSKCNQFCCVTAHALGIARTPSRVDPQVAPFDPSQCSQPLQEGIKTGLSFRVVRREIKKDGDTPLRFAGLRAYSNWPHCSRSGAAEERDELPPPHTLFLPSAS